MTDAPKKIWVTASVAIKHWMDIPSMNRAPRVEYTRTDISQARIAELEAGSVMWRRNLRDSFDAMCAMRNDINDVIQMPSIESDLLDSPETSVFCNEVAYSVIEKVKDQQARIAHLEAALLLMVNHEVDYMDTNNLGDPEEQHRIKQARAALKAKP
jgi:hypothetical protein